MSIYYHFDDISRLVTEIDRDSTKFGLIILNNFLTKSPLILGLASATGVVALWVNGITSKIGLKKNENIKLNQTI